MNVKMHNAAVAAILIGLFAVVTLAQAPSGMTITATSANVSGAGEAIEFDINRWSTDADRDKLSAAWNTKPPAPAPAAATSASSRR